MTPKLAALNVPVVEIVHHSAPSTWTATERRDLAVALRERGTTITELSDARELLGFARLSDSSDWDRQHALENLESPELQAALEVVRARRAWLLEQLAETVDWKARRQAHKLLDLKGEKDLRIGELQALYAQARICEIAAEQPRARPVVRPVPVWTEAELFAGAAAL